MKYYLLEINVLFALASQCCFLFGAFSGVTFGAARVDLRAAAAVKDLAAISRLEIQAKNVWNSADCKNPEVVRKVNGINEEVAKKSEALGRTYSQKTIDRALDLLHAYAGEEDEAKAESLDNKSAARKNDACAVN